MDTTKYVGLQLHGTSAEDLAVTFGEWRASINGEGQSNMQLIDTAIQEAFDRIPLRCSVVEDIAKGFVIEIDDALPQVALSADVDIAVRQSGSGTVSPTNVRSVLGRSSISMTRITGKNLINGSVDTTSSSVSFVGADSVVTINGTPQSTSSVNVAFDTIRLSPGTYTLSYTTISGSVDADSNITIVSCVDENGTILKRVRLNEPSATFSIAEDCEVNIRIMRASSSTTYNNFTFSVQLEKGDVATAFEPPQHYVKTTELGSTIYGGSIDLVSGIMTVSSVAKTLNGEMTFNKQKLTSLDNAIYASYTFSLATNGFPTAKQRLLTCCSHFATGKVASNASTTYNAISLNSALTNCIINVEQSVCGSTIEEFCAYLESERDAGRPVVIVYELAEPYIVQLEPQQFELVDKNMVLYSNSGDVSLRYAIGTQQYLDKKVNLLRQALLSINNNA